MQKTWMPTVAGLLSIIAGAIGILAGIIAIVLVCVMMNSQYYYGPEDEYIRNPAVWALFIPYFIFSIIAIAGGVMAIQRRFWVMALAGAICSILSIWGWILGIASIVFLILSKGEFGPPAVMPPTPVENIVIPAKVIGKDDK